MITSREKDVDHKKFSVCALEMLGEMHGHTCSNRYDVMAEADTLQIQRTNKQYFICLFSLQKRIMTFVTLSMTHKTKTNTFLAQKKGVT